MIMREFITDDEKGMRQIIYIQSEAKKAKKVDGAMSIWDLLNTTTDKGIFLVFKQGWAPLEHCNIHCDSILIDGAHGYKNPDETEFFPIESYGQTWAAVQTGLTIMEEDWNTIISIQNILNNGKKVSDEIKQDATKTTKPKWVELTYISPWSHEKEVCVLTSAKATGYWEGYEYAIYDRDEILGAHVAFHPLIEKTLGTRPIDVNEARKWVNALCVRSKAVVDNFNEIYGQDLW